MTTKTNCFLSQNKTKQTLTLIAIDPGVCGGIAIMRGPKISTQSLKNFPDAEIVSFLRSHAGPDAVAYLEKVGGYIPTEEGEGQPGSRMFTFGDSYGYLRGVLDTLGIKRVNVVPQMWQRGIAGRKGSYSQRKRALRDHAARLFPGIDVTAETADALGILHYARFRETGSNGGYVANESVLDLPLPEQMALAVKWCESAGWPIPAPRTPERAAMFDYWRNVIIARQVA